MDSSPAPTTSDRLPDWLAEALDVLSARRRLVVATAVGLMLLGAIVSLLAPSILPPRAIVGAAVGVAAALLATALALALDASDLVVRGVRHVRAAGGTVDVRVGRQPDDVGPLLAAVARHAGDGPLRIALAPASRSAGVPGARASALAEALARTGRRVLLTDLTRGGTPAAGLSDVISGARTLSEVVRFEEDLYLARLAVGSTPDVAIRGFAGWVEGLPSDLEVLVAALPPLAETGVLSASASLDVTFVLVEVDRTERVDLIASLDAVDAAGLTSELVLVDPDRTPPTAAASAEDDAEPDDGELDDTTEGRQVPAAADDDLQADPDTDEEVAALLGAAAAIDTVAESPVTSEPPIFDEVAAATSDEALSQEPTAADVPQTLDEPPSGPQQAPVPDHGPVLDHGPVPDHGAEADPAPAPDPAPPTDDEVPASDAPASDATAELDLSGLAAAPAPAPEPDLSARIWERDSSADVVPADDAPTTTRDEGFEPSRFAHDPETTADEADEEPPAPSPERDAPTPRPSTPRQEDPALDDAALQAARTSAALQQLAQQIWERDER